MDETTPPAGPSEPTSEPRADALVRQFVEHWGMMARAWGINPTMGELFAILYITGTDWTAEELQPSATRVAGECQHEPPRTHVLGSRPQASPPG